MRLDAVLNSGQMLVLASHPNRPGSLGHHFFKSDDSDDRERKLLLIRLAKSRGDDLKLAEPE